MDQGPTHGHSHKLCVLELDCAVCTGEFRGGLAAFAPNALLTDLAAVFCANFLRLSASRSLVNLFLAFLQTFFRKLADRERSTSNSVKCQNNQTTRNRIAEHLAPEKLLRASIGYAKLSPYVSFLQWLGFGVDGPELPTSEALTATVKRLDCAPACRQRSRYSVAQARSLFLLLPKSTARQAIMQVERYSLGVALLCDFPKVTKAESLCKPSHCGSCGN